MTVTQWRPVVGWGGMYEASDSGLVRSLDRVVVSRSGRTRMARGRILKPYIQHSDVRARWKVGLCREGKKHNVNVHTAVAEAFLGVRPDGFVCRHLDGDRDNNSLPNLAWGTPSENSLDAVRHGTQNSSAKTHCPQGHEYTTRNTRYVRSGRWRTCRACISIANAKHREAHKS